MTRAQAKKTDARQSNRLTIFLVGGIFFASAIVGRLGIVQVMKHGYYVALAEDQHELVQKLHAKRGEIYFQEHGTDELFPAAVNQKLYQLTAVPKFVKNDSQVVSVLTAVFQISDPQELDLLRAKLANKQDSYEVLKRKVTDDQKAAIDKMHIAGLNFSEEDGRLYPEGALAAQVIGFLGSDEKGDRMGRYGIEGYYNEQLEGHDGVSRAETDTAGRWISVTNRDVEAPHDGDNLVLTIDRVVQYKAQERLAQAVKEYDADRGSVIVMDPHTGAVIAMATVPTFDPNNYSKVDSYSVYSNLAINGVYEPGSIFKPLNMAAGIDAGVVEPDTTYEDKGSVTIGKYTIRNALRKSYGVQTMTQVLEKSLNTGMVLTMEKMGLDTAYDYLTRFGFRALTGIDLDQEAGSNIRDKEKVKDIDLATMGFGQGIGVTPIQMITAFSAIVNDGKIMKPYVVDREIAADGTEKRTKPEVVTQAITPRTAAKVAAMLVSVVEHGHNSAIAGYRVGGKTGTAQVPNKSGGGYDENQRIASFMGFAPLDNPRFTMLVRLDNPRKSVGSEVWGETTAAPIFHDLGKFLLTYYQISPTQ